MYTPVKDKFDAPPSPRLYSLGRRIVPRYIKAYIWLVFLAFVFGTMLIYDNNIYTPSFLTRNSTPAGNATSSPLSDVDQVGNTTMSLQDHLQTKPGSPRLLNPQQHSMSLPEVYGTGATAFTPDDVLIMFKTGATSLWRRVPMHLSTTLADEKVTPNVVFYSDQADNIAGRPVIDVLANVSAALKASPDFKLYHSLPKIRSDNLYLENAAMEGDHYLAGGWRLDKYKFLPMMAHAAKYHPDKKWYIYMEDDNYFFWKALYSWLGNNYDPEQPFLLGSPAARLGEDFAHGGSGFVVSGAAMRQTFGSHPDLIDEYESYAVDRCCGDLTLSHVMKDLGVTRDRRHDHSSWVGLQAMSTWRMAFGKWNWCSPILNVHKVHQSDLSRLHVLERDFQAEHRLEDGRLDPTATMTWGQLFERTILPLLKAMTTINTTDGADEDVIRPEWDNAANEKWFASKLELHESLSQQEKEAEPWYSMNSCRQACVNWDQCLTWKYQDDACGLSSTIALGSRVDEGVKIDSGFMIGRVTQLVENKVCQIEN